MDIRDVLAAYWVSANARDWARFGELIAPGVVYELPQTRERIRGRERYVQFNTEYPGAWVVEPVRIVGQGSQGATWTRFVINGEEQPGLCFFELDDAGLIARITDFWPMPYEPPPGREHLVERY